MLAPSVRAFTRPTSALRRSTCPGVWSHPRTSPDGRWGGGRRGRFIPRRSAGDPAVDHGWLLSRRGSGSSWLAMPPSLLGVAGVQPGGGGERVPRRRRRPRPPCGTEPVHRRLRRSDTGLGSPGLARDVAFGAIRHRSYPSTGSSGDRGRHVLRDRAVGEVRASGFRGILKDGRARVVWDRAPVWPTRSPAQFLP